ncbi:MAG: histidine kinase, partial [Cephaloticoccus sp.]
GLLAGLVALHIYERRESSTILDKVRDQRTELTNQVLELLGATAEKFIYEYAQWTEEAQFVAAETPDEEWAEINLVSGTTTYKTEVVWIFKPDGTLFYAQDADTFPGKVVPAPPDREQLIAKLRAENLVHFFHQIDGTLYEIRGGPITLSVGWEETDEVHGYMVVGRKWDDSFINKLSRLLDSQVVLSGVNHFHEEEPDAFSIHSHRDLPGIDGTTIASLDVTYRSPELRQVADTDWWEALIFAVYGGLAILAVMGFGYRWVLQPLGRISTSLSTRDIAPLERMLGDRSELGRVANLIKSAFQDREDLKKALEERARLGRDLHDGVIQTLYASGMSLASIQANLRKNPEAASVMVEQTRRELNATIRDVRNFITRLEPESAQQQNFAEALQTLLDFMRGGLPIECTTNVDAGVDSDLPMDIRAHLLQIVREAASNAFRHSECTRFHVTLHRTEGALEFAATDNGSGFDPDAVSEPGQGLKNFRERASELGAKLDIVSRPGQGAIIRLRIPI